VELPPPPDEWHDISTFPRFLRWITGRGVSWTLLTVLKVLVAILILAVVSAAGGAIVWGILLLGRNG
jgi:hypothetical protein